MLLITHCTYSTPTPRTQPEDFPVYRLPPTPAKRATRKKKRRKRASPQDSRPISAVKVHVTIRHKQRSPPTKPTPTIIRRRQQTQSHQGNITQSRTLSSIPQIRRRHVRRRADMDARVVALPFLPLLAPHPLSRNHPCRKAPCHCRRGPTAESPRATAEEEGRFSNRDGRRACRCVG